MCLVEFALSSLSFYNISLSMSIARMNVRTSAQLTAFSAIHVISIGVSKYMCNGQAF